MSGLILACSRNRAAPRYSADDLAACAAHLNPDNIQAHGSDRFEQDGLARVVVNPVPGVRTDARGACVGPLFGESDWATLGSSPPDGTFAIVRHDRRSVELVTDIFATRTIWYILTDDAFLASTSQRAIVALLGSFAPCAETVTWMIASGNLGPGRGWDERLERVANATCLRLDRETWSLSSRTSHIPYAPAQRAPEEHLTRVREAIFGTCARLDVQEAPAVLTLSGGHDSRSLLAGLTHADKPVTCVTWGLADSLTEPTNDAYIARQLATSVGMKHEYLLLDSADDPVRQLFTRFLCAGEGRVEDFSGYTDGFKAWRHLFESGVATVIRGDSPGWGFPFPPVNTFVTRSIVHEMTLVSDYPDNDLIRRLSLPRQHPPEGLFPKPDETLDHYRDRIYNDYELGTCMAAFNQVKCAFTEVANPLLARDVVQTASELPDELRHLRCGFEKMVAALMPGVPFAEHGADEPLDRYLAKKDVREELAAELSSAAARLVLSPAALAAVIADLERPRSRARRRLRSRIRAVVPNRLVRAVRPVPRPHLATAALAYRAYIASRMATILRDDAQALERRA